MGREPAPLTSHPREANVRPARFPASGALGIVGQVALLKVVRVVRLSRLSGGCRDDGARARTRGRVIGRRVERGALQAIGNGKLQAHGVHVVIADLAIRSQHVLHFFAANVAEFPLGIAKRIRGVVGPHVGHGVLDEGGGHADARQGHVLQALFVHDKVAY